MSLLLSFMKALKILCIWASVLLLFATSHKLQAQDRPAGDVWSLQGCIDYAIKQNITIQQSDLQIQIDENNYLQSKINRYPDLNGFANQQFSSGRSIDPFSNQFVNRTINSNNFSLSSSITIFDGFRISNTIKRNQINVNLSRLSAEQARYDVSLNIALAYLNILLNQELLAVAQQNVISTQTQLERTQKLFDAGAVAENNLIDLKATLANNELAVVNAENSIMISSLNLQQLMNLEVSPNFQVEPVNVDALEVTDFAESSQQIYQTAEGFLPNIRQAELAIERDDYNIEIAKSGRYPTLSANASVFTGYSSAGATRFTRVLTGSETQEIGFLTGDPNVTVSSLFPVSSLVESPYTFFPQLGDNIRQQVGFSLSIPIFNRWQVKNQINNAGIGKKITELSARNARIQLRQTIEQAYVDAKSALNTYRARERQVEALTLTYDNTKIRYEAGAANVVDFNLAKITLDNAKSDLVRAKYDYLFREKVLDFYQNKPLSFD